MRHLLILVLLIQIFSSCKKESRIDLARDYLILNDKIGHNGQELVKCYLLNPDKVKPYYKASKKISDDILKILNLLSKKDFNKINKSLQDLEYEILNNTLFDSQYFLKGVIAPRLNYWLLQNKELYTNSDIECLKWDLLNLENDVSAFLYDRIDKYSYKFNKLIPIVIDSSNIVKVGDIYSSKIILAAIDTTVNPEIMVADISQPDSILNLEIADNERLFNLLVENGFGLYNKSVSHPGKQGYKGVIKIKNPHGELEKFIFRKEFTVRK